jgi:hypothetical protein
VKFDFFFSYNYHLKQSMTMTPQLYPDVLRYIASFIWNPDNMRTCKAWRNALRLSAIQENGGLECVNLSYKYNSKAIVDMIGPRTQCLGVYMHGVMPGLNSHPHYNNLVKLKLLGDTSTVTELPEFPPTLQSLFIWNFKDIQKIPDLPITLKRLDIWNCQEIRVFPTLPPTIERIDMWEFPWIYKIPELPETVKHLDLQMFSSVRVIEKFPSYLNALVLRNVHVRELPKFPQTLQRLTLLEMPYLRLIHDLPQTLQHLTIEEVQFERVLEFPPALLHLSMSYNNRVRGLPTFPSTLQVLKINNLQSLKKIPDVLPAGLQHLEIYQLYQIIRIPDFPKSLKYISICIPDRVEIPFSHLGRVVEVTHDNYYKFTAGKPLM